MQNKQVKVKLPEQAANSSIGPADQIKFEQFEIQGWQFYHSVKGMSSEKEMDQVSDRVGIMTLPEVFYGQNHLYIVNKKYGVLLDFNAVDSLSFAGYDKRRIFLDTINGKNFFVPPEISKDMPIQSVGGGNDPESQVKAAEAQISQVSLETKNEETKTQNQQEQILAESLEKLILNISNLSKEEKNLNLIDVFLPRVQVAMAQHWKNKDKTKIKDYREVNETSDWTFSTPYKGTTRVFSDQLVQRILEFTNLDLGKAEQTQNNLEIKDATGAGIPMEMLGPENPILHYGEVYLYETDLEDCGYAMSRIRFRVMKDCFYVLLRNYLRVDGVLVRIIDTRTFHEFGTDYIHREFQYRESTYDQLRMKGFDLSSEWLLSPHQSDQIFNHLQVKMLNQERIHL